MKWGLKGGISVDADSGPPRYVLWCCGGICHQLLIFKDWLCSSMFQYFRISVRNVFFNLRIDDIEDEIYREKLKIKKVSDELSDTFDDMLDNY